MAKSIKKKSTGATERAGTQRCEKQRKNAKGAMKQRKKAEVREGTGEGRTAEPPRQCEDAKRRRGGAEAQKALQECRGAKEKVVQKCSDAKTSVKM